MNSLLDMTAEEELDYAPPAKQKILLVDDDPAIRQILCRLLVDEDYLVETAANGVEALETIDDSIDLVLLDLNMPVKDGWDTFEALSFKYPWLPIILITARPNQFFPRAGFRRRRAAGKTPRFCEAVRYGAHAFGGTGGSAPRADDRSAFRFPICPAEPGKPPESLNHDATN